MGKIKLKFNFKVEGKHLILMICLENLKISRIVSESDRLTHNEQPDYRTHEVKIRRIKMGPVQGRVLERWSVVKRKVGALER